MKFLHANKINVHAIYSIKTVKNNPLNLLKSYKIKSKSLQNKLKLKLELNSIQLLRNLLRLKIK